jgi:hypothetical protein
MIRRGHTFSRLTTLRRTRRDGRAYWFCECRCGRKKLIREDGLQSGAVLSCGCLHRERTSVVSSRPIPTGARFGRLTIVRRAASPTRPGHGQEYQARCVCGRIVRVESQILRAGRKRSCGCLKRDRWKRQLRHGHGRRLHRSPEYLAFHGAKAACLNPDAQRYPRTGALGIEFLFASFERFLAQVGMRPSPSHRLTRLDPDGDYEVGNVQWITRKGRR